MNSDPKSYREEIISPSISEASHRVYLNDWSPTNLSQVDEDEAQKTEGKSMASAFSLQSELSNCPAHVHNLNDDIDDLEALRRSRAIQGRNGSLNTTTNDSADSDSHPFNQQEQRAKTNTGAANQPQQNNRAKLELRAQSPVKRNSQNAPRKSGVSKKSSRGLLRRMSMQSKVISQRQIHFWVNNPIRFPFSHHSTKWTKIAQF